MTRTTAAFLLGVFFLAAVPATAGENPHLEEARSLYRRLQYVEVVDTLKKALKVKGNTRAQQCEIYALLGTVFVILEQDKNAAKAFGYLLKIDPAYSLGPGISPKILDFYRKVKKDYTPPVKFVKQRVLTKKGHLPRLVVQLDDRAKAVQQMELWARWARQNDFKKKSMEAGPNGRYRAPLPVKPGQSVEYFMQARGQDGKVLAWSGSSGKPLIYTLEKTVHPGDGGGPAGGVTGGEEWYRKWWVWTAVGAVVVAVTVGVAVGASGSEEVPTGSLGVIELP